MDNNIGYRTGFFLMRAGLGLVFLIFGAGKFQGDFWAETMCTMPFFGHLPWSPDTSVLAAGVLEVSVGTALLTGVATRFFSVLAAAMLLGILFLTGFQETRDIGLLGTALFLTVVRDESFRLRDVYHPGRGNPFK